MRVVPAPIALSTADWTALGAVAGVVAVVVAVAALVHQMRSSRSQTKSAEPASHPQTDVELQMSWLIPAYGSHLGNQDIGMTLVNRLPYAVTWSSASVDINDGSGQRVALLDTAQPGLGLPQQVPAQGSAHTTVSPDALADHGVDLTRPIVAHAVLGTGDQISSVPWTPEKADSK